jgi:hypothetical protein
VSETIYCKKYLKLKEKLTKMRKLHKEALHNLYISQNTIRVIESRKIRWAAHVA